MIDTSRSTTHEPQPPSDNDTNAAHDCNRQQTHCQTQHLIYENAYLSALQETTLALMNRINLESLLEFVIARAADIVDAPHGYIYLQEGNMMEIKMGIGVLKEQVGFRVHYGEGMGGMVWKTGKPVLVKDYYTWKNRAPDFAQTSIGAIIGVPLTSGGQVVGVLGLAHDVSEGTTFSARHIERLNRFAELASIAIDNARLYSSAQNELQERKRIEADLQKAKEAAESANYAKSAFLANMSHELRTPLNAIIGYCEMIKEDIEDTLNEPEQKTAILNDLNHIHRASNHLLTIINDILDLSKIEAGKMELFIEVFDIHSFIQTVETTVMPLFKKNANTFSVVCAPTIGTMHSDQTKIRQILFNLLSNAAKFTKRGTVTLVVSQETPQTISSTLEQYTPPDTTMRYDDTMDCAYCNDNRNDTTNDMAWVSLTVSDTGIGMSPEQVEHLFEIFMQADASTTRKYGGTGLGLALTRRLCMLLRGTIHVTSVLDAGTTFTVYLPLHVRL